MGLCGLCFCLPKLKLVKEDIFVPCGIVERALQRCYLRALDREFLRVGTLSTNQLLAALTYQKFEKKKITFIEARSSSDCPRRVPISCSYRSLIAVLSFSNCDLNVVVAFS